MIRVLNNPEEFLDKLDNFKNINPFYSVAFFRNYIKQYSDKSYLFLEVCEGDVIKGLVPLEMIKNLPGLKVFQFIAHRKANYHNYICENSDVRYVHNEIKSYFQNKKYVTRIIYYDINDSSSMYQCLTEDTEIENGMVLYDCPAVVINGDFNDYFIEQVKEAKKRTEIRKFIKKLNAIGNLELITIDDIDSYESNRNMIDQVFLLHKERFDGVYTPSHFSDIKLRGYYSNLIKDTISDGAGYLSLLVLDNTVVSFVYCLRNQSLLTDWIPAFDPAFTKYNLGTAHYYLLFEKLFKEGWCNCFDYSKGDSVYKRRWANTETKNYSFDLQIGFNVISGLIGTIDSAKNTLKVRLREKGILKKIKKFMGFFVKENVGEDIPYVHIDIVETDSCVDGNFTYDLIRHGEISKREYILNALYAGKKVNITKQNEYSITAEVEKQ